jgi:hypothetical protein
MERYFDSLRFYESERYDMISLGYGQNFIHLGNDSIAIAHDLKNQNNNIESTMIFKGHSHKSKTRENKIIYVPALTDNYQGAYEFTPIPGFLDVEFNFFDNMIYRVYLKQLAFINDEIRLANEEVMTIRPDLQERQEKNQQKKLAYKQKK